MSSLKNDKRSENTTNRRSVTEFLKTRLDFDHLATVFAMMFVIGFLVSVTVKSIKAGEYDANIPKTYQYMDVPLPAKDDVVKEAPVRNTIENIVGRLVKSDKSDVGKDKKDLSTFIKENGSVSKTRIKDKADLYKYMKKAKIKFPELVWAQAMLESQWMSSPVFDRSDNLFGMKKSGWRPNLQVHKKGDPYSHFRSVKHCVLDYRLHQAYVLNVKDINSERAYLNKLVSSGYIRGDDSYRQKILSIRNKTNFTAML